ncbi:MAG: hypothetical protein MZU84_02180 [Sphingobacterium sp.]|nr:hypothetical protein [Sphingobacterium sp.]
MSPLRAFDDEGRARRVPGRVAARLERGAHAAGGEADEASGSPWTSCLPRKLSITPPVAVDVQESESCFSAVRPVCG